MNDFHRVVVTVLVSAASAGLVCAVLVPTPPLPRQLPAGPEVDWTPVRLLEARVQTLEGSSLLQRANVPPPPDVQLAPPTRTDAGADLAHRVDGIEVRVRRLEQVAAAAPQPEQLREAAPDKNEATQWIVDRGVDDAKKVRAHQALRSVPDAYSPAMIAELLRIATTNPDGRVRADVWCFFDGKTRLPAIVAPLVRALEVDTDARAREEAADTLGSYLDDPIVEPALKRAAEADSSESVRAKARRTLKARRSYSPVSQDNR